MRKRAIRNGKYAGGNRYAVGGETNDHCLGADGECRLEGRKPQEKHKGHPRGSIKWC